MGTNVVEKSDRKNTTFMIRFNQLRGDRSQATFGKLLGLSAATIGFYENGERLPNAADLLRIATVCGVSTDWLLGLSEVKNPDTTVHGVCDYTGLDENAVELLHEEVDQSGEGQSPVLLLLNILIKNENNFLAESIRGVSYFAYDLHLVAEGMRQLTITDILNAHNGITGINEYARLTYLDAFEYRANVVKNHAAAWFAQALNTLANESLTREYLKALEDQYWAEYAKKGIGDNAADEEHP